MELRRSRRLAGKEPEYIPPAEVEKEVEKEVEVVRDEVYHRRHAAVLCGSAAVAFLGSFLATFTLVRAAAAACATSYCLF